MGIQDRDWYWEHKRQQEDRAPRKAAEGRALLERTFKRRPPSPREWHPFLSFLLFVVLAAGTYFAIKLVVALLGR